MELIVFFWERRYNELTLYRRWKNEVERWDNKLAKSIEGRKKLIYQRISETSGNGEIGILLSEIYTLANSNIRENRERYGLTRAAFCRRHDIPRRTAESWEMEQNKIAPYLKELFDYSFLIDPKQEEENRMLKLQEELQEVLDFIEQDFGVLLNNSKINDSQVSEFETNGKIKFECYHDKNKYAIVSKDEIELDGFTDHYQTGDFEVYYFGA